MKYLYLWNDLQFFFHNPDSREIEKKVELFFEVLNQNGTCTYELLHCNILEKWTAEIKSRHFENVITIGTRPEKLQSEKWKQIERIFPKRSFQSNGFTKSLTFSDPDLDVLQQCSTLDELHIIEDIVVTGHTLDKICELLFSKGFKGMIYFHLFAISDTSLEALTKSWNTKIKFEYCTLLQRKEYEKSTLICLYDLLYNYLGDQRYRDRTELLEIFFSNNVPSLLKILDEIEIYLNKEKTV